MGHRRSRQAGSLSYGITHSNRLMGQIKFGTDGWRAVIAEDFTFANVARVAQATADYWTANPIAGTEKKVIVGYDRRFLSDQFARRTAEVFCGNGFKVVLTNQPTPTPAVSYAVKTRQAAGGVMITASHNPPAFNGFKLKAHFGGSAEPSMCQGVESLLDRSPVQFRTLDNNAAVQVDDIRPAHFAAIKKLVDFKLIARSKLRFAPNCSPAPPAASPRSTGRTIRISAASTRNQSRRITAPP
jgi:phosphomannomutase